MKNIILSQEKFALVDDEDYEWLNQWKWCALKCKNTYYAERWYQGKIILMHRLLLNAPGYLQVDHINGNGLWNCRANLRLCTNAQNSQNGRSHCDAVSKYRGVYWHKQSRRWEAGIRISYKRIYLGLFLKEIEAAKVYDKAAIKLHKEFAHLNFPLADKLEKEKNEPIE